MTETLHLIKLCVGAKSVEDLLSWQRSRYADGPAQHVTRMWPKRAEGLLAGGSLYWVIKGAVLARQTLLGLEERRGADGILRCALILSPEIIRTEAQPRRPFQGWRYLSPKDAPRDLPRGREHADPLPRDLLDAMSVIGLR
ncbi:DUF1489 family protein [Phaeovulum sp.]|uniref:DUF1489 family protein n=1 Tax=Phaeovulum sp. TaxID=2934796 RepID=UPI003564D2C1